MAAVDLAAFAVLRRNGLLKHVNFRRIFTPQERNPQLSGEQIRAFQRRQALPIEYTLLRDCTQEVQDSAAILFWGDFLHSREYIFQVSLLLLDRGFAPTPAEALELTMRNLCLSDAAEEVLRRSIVFGGTLIFNRERDYRDPFYAPAVTRLFQHSADAMMRDVYSALRVDAMRGTCACSSLGVDSALLLRPADSDLLPAAQGNYTPGSIGIFFGRHGSDATLLGRFSRDICTRLQASGYWIPWFDPSYNPNHLPTVCAAFPELELAQMDDPHLGELMAAIRGCRAVITDTYHLCVNAWSAGVPAICIGSAWTTDGLDISSGWRFAWRDKRQVFLAMHDAMEYFIFSDELADTDAYEPRCAQITELLNTPESAAAVADLIAARSRIAEERLTTQLFQLLRGLVPRPQYG
jgi:hypothetical protein